MCSTTPHTCVCHSLIYSLTSLTSLLFLLFLFLLLWCVCLPLPLCLKGFTALMLASRYGHTATVELLLGARADKEAKGEVKET